MSSQLEHSEYGGVIPELASRLHQQKIMPIVETALKDANVKKSELSAIGFTNSPGLLGALLVGVSFAKGLALSLDIPLITVNHIHAHIHALFIEHKNIEFPFLCLVVSGGHTQIILVKDYFEFEIIGETMDDAAGEALDKAGKLMQLPYPAGPKIDQLAKDGNPDFHQFAWPEIQKFDYSFSGIKTNFLYYLRKEVKNDKQFIEKNINHICASYQKHVIQILLKKFTKASKSLNIKNLAIVGGVSANSYLRSEIRQYAEQNNLNVFIPSPKYCTDNGAMVAMNAWYKFQAGNFESHAIRAIPS